MKNLPQAYYASRVTESLTAIADYVQQARDIAADIRPVKESNPTLTTQSVLHRPELISVAPSASSETKLRLIGRALEHVESFILIPATDLSDHEFSASLKDKSLAIPVYNPVTRRWSIEATLDKFADAPAGDYHAWVRDKYAQEFLLEDALTVEEEEEEEGEQTPVPVPVPRTVDWDIEDFDPKSAQADADIEITLASKAGVFPNDLKFTGPGAQFLRLGKIKRLGDNTIKLPVEILQRAAGRKLAITAHSKSGKRTFTLEVKPAVMSKASSKAKP